jgi:hypothetical protein
MKSRKIIIKQNDKFFVWSMYLVFGCLILFAGVLGYRLYKASQTPPAQKEIELSTGEKIWMDYTNTEYQFSMDVPRLLTKREVINSQGYRYFMILGENQLSKGKGVSVGVTDRSVDQEIEENKRGYTNDGSAELASEKEIEIVGEKGKQLSFKPKGEDKSLETRDVVIFSHNNVTITIATTPEQIDHIVESFKFN